MEKETKERRYVKMQERTLLWLAGAIGLLGNITANFLLETTKGDLRFAIGLLSTIGFLFLLWALSKGYGRIDFSEKK